MHSASLLTSTAENPVSADLDGEVGCYNLLVRAVCCETVDDDGDPSWSYIAQQLRPVDSIDGSLMHMILKHRSAEADVGTSSDDGLLSVKTLLQQFPTVPPESLSRLVVNPTALLDMHGKCLYVSSSSHYFRHVNMSTVNKSNLAVFNLNQYGC